ncbi:hypothetical protein M3Y94_01250700 [Aphelenchoides besseyi]|nr:hypothetical protein M3Y94_01250700 [Aphelenchoides besseyi]
MIVGFVLTGISIGFYIALLYGNVKERPIFYIPVIVLTCTVILMMFGGCCGLFVYAILLVTERIKVDTNTKDFIVVVSFFYSAFYLVAIMCQCYAVSVVYRDYVYLKSIKGTLIFAVFGIVFNFFFSFNGLGSRIPWYFPASALIGVFEIATYVCLLIGNMKHWPQLYLPFLFINGGITLLMVVCVIGFYVIGILLLLDKIHLTAEYNDVYGTLSVVIAAIYTLAAIFQSVLLESNKIPLCCGNINALTIHYSRLLYESLVSIVKTLTLLVVIGMCVCGILVLFGHFNVRDEYRNTIGALTVVFAILYLFVILFQVYIGTIVYRDWIYIKELNIDNRKE